ncbi:MAG: glycosyltransferase family 2 protein [Pseudomonadota bacterium]
MKLTVATVALNAANDLPLTLESVIGQDYPDIELLVVDGASWDDTPEVLARYDDAIDRLEVIEDAGIFDAMNKAAAMASGDMILFLNAGDRFHNASSVRCLVERRRPNADIVYGNHIYRDGGREEFRQSWDFSIAMAQLRAGELSLMWLERFPAHQATMTRTSLLQELKYDTSFRICADHDFFLRAAAAGAVTQYVDELVCIYVGGGFSVQKHDLLKLEWNALHRRFSAYPDVVDRWYYGGLSPFEGTRSAAAGSSVAGLHEQTPASPGRGINHAFQWLSGGGARFAAPSDDPSSSLTLRGTNPFPRQSLEVFASGSLIAKTAVPSGPFSIDIVFADVIAPGAIIDVVPEVAEALDAQSGFVALAIKDFQFRGDATTRPRPAGTIQFNKSVAHENADLMGAGWYQFEPTFVWSRGMLSEVRVSSEFRITRLGFDIRPNPGITGQNCAVLLNGTVVADGPVASAKAIEVGNVWRTGGRDNVIAFKPSASASVGSDPRDLGIALVSIEIG